MAEPKPDAAQSVADNLRKLLEAAGMGGDALKDALARFAAESSAPKAPLLRRLAPRMLACLLLAVAMAAGVALVSPQQVTVALYKLSLVTMAGYLGYWLDRWCFPYARPDSFLASPDWRAEKDPAADKANHPVAPGCEQVFAAAMLRRGLVMLGVMLALGLGL